MGATLSIRSFSFATYNHLHDYHQLVIPIHGAADNYTALGDGRIGPGQCIVFPAGCEHRFLPDEQSRFLVADMNELPSSLQNLTHPVVTIPAPVQSFCCYVERQLEYSITPAFFECIGDLFFKLLEEQVFLPRIDPRIAGVLEHLEKDISLTLSLAELADVACLSLSQLKNLFKKELGESPSQHMLRLRMEKARALLVHTDDPVNIEYSASKLGVFTFMTPLFGIAFGVWLLDEPLDDSFIFGALMVMSGIVMVNGHKKIERRLKLIFQS